MSPLSDLAKGDCLAFSLPDGRFGAAVVLERGLVLGQESVLIAITRLAMTRTPNAADVAAAEVLTINYDGLRYPTREVYVLRMASFAQHAFLFAVSGRLPVHRTFKMEDHILAGDGWDSIPDTVSRQHEWESTCAGPDERMSVKDLLVQGS